MRRPQLHVTARCTSCVSTGAISVSSWPPLIQSSERCSPSWYGRSRSNVWHYAGVNAFRAGRMDELRAHPTAKPVALVADAIRDCTRRGDIVLDTFSGSGTTIMAAERVGRRARALEIDPRFVDVAVCRWQAFTRRD